MKKLTSAESIITINHFKNVLESEGIPCRIKNEHLGSIVGEMPFIEVWPELWVINDIDFDRARQLIDAAIVDESTDYTPAGTAAKPCSEARACPWRAARCRRPRCAARPLPCPAASAG